MLRNSSTNHTFLYYINVMAIDRETLSIVQFLRFIDRDGIGQSQLVIHNFSIFLPLGAEHSTRWLPESQGLISGREKLGQSAIGIALYQGLMIPSRIRPTISSYDGTIV